MSVEIFEKKTEKFFKKPIIGLGIILGISLILRILFLPNYPLTLDSLDYFFYALDIKINSHIPINYTPANNGWPLFLAFFFSLADFSEVFSYMQLQRILSVILSVITIIPIYFLIRKFFDIKLGITGAAIFAFEPRLIQNSLLGITDALYIFLVTITLCLFLSSKKAVYASFAIGSLATIVRSEGIILLIAISIMYFIKFRNERKEYSKFIFAVIIMTLILFPMGLFKAEITGNDLIFSRATDAIETFDKHMNEGNEYGNNPFFTGIEFFSRFLLLSMIPIFGFFVPIGIFFILKKINFQKIFLIVGIVTFSIPAFWAYTLPLQDSRYLFFMYPFFVIISLYTIQKISNRKFSNIILLLIIGGVFLSSIIFIDFKIHDNMEEESYQIVKILAQDVEATNNLMPQSKFFEVINYPSSMNEFSKFFETDRKNYFSIRHNIENNISIYDSNKANSVEELILNSEKKLTHIIVDESDSRKDYLKEIFTEKNNIDYLIKEFDSNEQGYDYHLKSFKIDYEKFAKLEN